MFQSHSIIESLECYIKTNISPQILKEAFPAMVLWLLVPDKQFKSPLPICGGVLILVNFQDLNQTSSTNTLILVKLT